jgi:hypothetical protein
MFSPAALDLAGFKNPRGLKAGAAGFYHIFTEHLSGGGFRRPIARGAGLPASDFAGLSA